VVGVLTLDFVQDIEDAFVVVDVGQLFTLHARWKATLPRIQPFYAVKCNEDKVLLRTMTAMGMGFDCASKVGVISTAAVIGFRCHGCSIAGEFSFLLPFFPCSQNEIQAVLDVGVSLDRIIYANPCKQISHLAYSAKVGVDLMTFDNEWELHKVKEHFPQAKYVLKSQFRCWVL